VSAAAPRRILVVIAALLLVAVPASCADDQDDMTGPASIELATAVQTVRDRIEADDLFGAAGALGELRTTVANLVSTGAITADRGERILTSIDGLEGELVASLQASTTTTTSTTVPPTTVPPSTAAPTTTSTTTQPGESPGNKKNDKDDKDDD
jgi:hypothetical protein